MRPLHFGAAGAQLLGLRVLSFDGCPVPRSALMRTSVDRAFTLLATPWGALDAKPAGRGGVSYAQLTHNSPARHSGETDHGRSAGLASARRSLDALVFVCL